MGVQEGDVISIISPNTVDYFVPVIAAFYIGVTINPVNPAYSTGKSEIIRLKLTVSITLSSISKSWFEIWK